MPEEYQRKRCRIEYSGYGTGGGEPIYKRQRATHPGTESTDFMKERKPKLPIVRYGWRDALGAVRRGCRLLEYADGHAEILNKGPVDFGAIGWVSKKSMDLVKSQMHREHRFGKEQNDND